MTIGEQLSLFDEPAPEQNSFDDKVTLLALAEIPGVGFNTVRTLFEACQGKLSRVWILSDDELSGYLRAARTPNHKDILTAISRNGYRYLQTAQERYRFFPRRNLSLIFKGDTEYPRSLLDLPDPPAWLFIEGNPHILQDPAIVGVVGTREPTQDGIDAAKWLSKLLATSRCVVLSGLAEGIDAVAHQTAVDYGTPTIAVLGHGVGVTFPASTSGLRREMINRGGAVVSEYLPRDNYARERFVNRNRIQAALSKVIGVVEGRAKSGTAHTARFSRELNRPLFGVRIGEELDVPQQELLGVLAQQGDKVFQLDLPESRECLKEFLRSHISEEDRKHRSVEPRLFRGLAQEIQRLATDYDAKLTDFDWLIGEMQKLRDELEKRNGKPESGDI
jgi:DNA processing protein